MATDLIGWLRDACSEYAVEPIAVFRRGGTHDWPLVAKDDTDLTTQLAEGGHFVPLPQEPAALANVIEVSLVDFLIRKLSVVAEVACCRGTERGYPDLEVSGQNFDGGYHAVDIKVARRAKNEKRTQSRITLYTGNTYFRYPQLRWPGTFRPFKDYTSHLDVIALYTLDRNSMSRVRDFEIVIQEAWRIGSKQRSSTTREYLGAVMLIEQLRSGAGEFASAEDFYKFWRKYPFKTGKVVEQQLKKLLATSSGLKEAATKVGPK
jgi:hypothetical protein